MRVKIKIKNKLEGKQKISIGGLNLMKNNFNKIKNNQMNEGQIEKNNIE